MPKLPQTNEDISADMGHEISIWFVHSLLLISFVWLYSNFTKYYTNHDFTTFDIVVSPSFAFVLRARVKTENKSRKSQVLLRIGAKSGVKLPLGMFLCRNLL